MFIKVYDSAIIHPIYIVCPHSLLFNVWFIVHDDVTHRWFVATGAILVEPDTSEVGVARLKASHCWTLEARDACTYSMIE
jgi:hypothetical protein